MEVVEAELTQVVVGEEGLVTSLEVEVEVVPEKEEEDQVL